MNAETFESKITEIVLTYRNLKPAFMEMEVGFLSIVSAHLYDVVRRLEIVLKQDENEVIYHGSVRG